MNTLIISLLTALLSIMQSPTVPAETKVEIYQQTMPVIVKYMEETKPEPEIGTATSTEAVEAPVGAETAPDKVITPTDEPIIKQPRGTNVEA